MKKTLTLGLIPFATVALLNGQLNEEEIPQDALVVIGDSETDFEFVEPPALAGSRDIITLDELEYEHPTDTLELFSKVPGVNLARYNQGIINTDVGIRGFGTDGVTPHAKSLIDGIPMNLHNGYNELDQMFSMGIGGIEVFKGTSDLRYGLYNVAGSYNVFSRTDLANEIQLTLDSFGSIETQLYSGTQIGDLTQNYFIGYRNAEGYRDHDDTEKYTFSGRWAYEVDDSLTIGASARFSGYEGDAPGYINDAEIARNSPTLSEDFAQNDRGEKDVTALSIFADKEFYDAKIQLSLKAYYNDISRERIVDFGFGGRDRVDDQAISGVILNANWDFTESFSLKAGLDYQHQDYQENYVRVDDMGNVTRVDSDHDYTLENWGGYIGIEYDSGSPFRFNTGVRIDHLSGEGLVGNRRGITSEETDFNTIFQPKLNLFYDIMNELTAFANYGRTFQAPLRGDLFSGERPNINNGGEIGLVYNFSDRSNIRFSLWQQVAENEYQVDQQNFAGYVSIGEVERRGLEIAFSYEVTDAFNVWGNYGYTKSEIKDDTAGFPGTQGNEVRSTPNHTYSLGASYNVTDALIVRLSLDGQGDYYINENNEGGKFGDYNIVSLGLDYDTSYGLVSFQINNLFDSYNEYVYDFSQDGSFSVHSPYDGINASISYKYEF